MKVVALLVAVLALVVASSAYQRAFYGGSFKQADGIYSPVFAAYDSNANGWRPVPTPDISTGRIYDIAPVGETGVFAVGAFISINTNVPSFSVAFFDGTKWCPIRHGLATTSEQNNFGAPGTGYAVWCNNGTSCYVAGSFQFIENQPNNAPNNPVNFAHYLRDASTGEWVFDPSILEWNNPSVVSPAQNLPNNIVPGTLKGVPANDPQYFFVGIGGAGTYGTPPGFSTIFRGGLQDGGWLPYLDPSTVFGVGAIRGFDVDDDAASPAVYVVSTSTSAPQFAAKSTVITRPCQSSTCLGSGIVTQGSDWVSLIPSGTSLVATLFDVVSVNATTRYYIGTYTPGGTFNQRNVVLRQDGFSSPEPVGAPFSRNSINLFRVELFEDKPFVVGDFETANLHYPDSTEDASGVDTADIRELDSVAFTAIYENGKWNSHFGGGLLPPGGSGDTNLATSLIVVRNPLTNVWYFTSPLITFVHNVKAEGLAYFDDSSDLNHKNIYPLFTSKITGRDGSGQSDGEVYDIACQTADCSWVYAGGWFSFHGLDSLGSVAKVQVRQDSPTVMSVGGGLWFTDNNVVPSEPTLQFFPGTVYALLSQGDYLYAGGVFSRGKNGYVCLNNLARIQHSGDTDTNSWEALAGGCDNEVYDLHFWGDDLYVAGTFTKCGSNVVNFVTAYQNGEYRSLNNGLDGTAYSLEYFQGRIIVGGQFSHAGGLPTGGIAAWDGQKWRALQAACTDDCIPGNLPLYFAQTSSSTPSEAYDLRASKDQTVLYARAFYPSVSGLLLSQWQYFDTSDNGRWTIKGDYLNFDTDFVRYGDAIINNGTQLVVAGIPIGETYQFSGFGVQAYSLENENWVDNDVLISTSVFVVRSSAATLTSFLSFLF